MNRWYGFDIHEVNFYNGKVKILLNNGSVITFSAAYDELFISEITSGRILDNPKPLGRIKNTFTFGELK
jgi:hypothetical protein